jgi:hypothetical protein
LRKGLWYPKVFPTSLPLFTFEYMKHRKFLWCFWSWRKPYESTIEFDLLQSIGCSGGQFCKINGLEKYA